MKKEVECSASASASASASLAGNKEILIQIDEWLFDVNEEGKHENKTWKIEKVPRIMREIKADEKDYDPLVVSIGPYHHGKPEFQFMENRKRKMARHYANNVLQTLQEMYTKVENVAKTAREFYKDDDKRSVSKLDDRKFTQMMFLDGCFVLQFIYCSTCNNQDDLHMKDNIAACVTRDLFLLENQLPFLVLTELMSLKDKPDEWKENLNKFIGNKLGMPSKTPKEDCSFAHLLEIIRGKLVGESKKATPNGDDWSTYRSAKELKAAGIQFKPSGTRELKDVVFQSTFYSATLNLPPITVDDSTKSMLLNMVAYEACPGGHKDFGVTSYICFLDSLIDHPEDVKEFRSKGILKNFLGSDQQVAELFNQIADNLVPNPHAYAAVKSEIEKHYKNQIKNWLAEFWHTHFTSPWTILAFLGVVLALALSVIQTFPSLISKEH